MSTIGNGHSDAPDQDEIPWEEHRAHVAEVRSPADVRAALTEALERDQLVIATQRRYLARYERDRAVDDGRHREVLGELARLCELVGGTLRVEARVAALERARTASQRRKLASLEEQRAQQRQAVEGVAYDPESTGVRRLVSTEQAIDELRHELLVHTTREQVREQEAERRRSLSEAEGAEERKARRDDTRAALRWVGGVVGAIVLALAGALLGRLTGRPVDLHPLGEPPAPHHGAAP